MFQLPCAISFEEHGLIIQSLQRIRGVLQIGLIQ